MSKYFLLLFLFALSACYYDNEEELYPTGTGTTCDTVVVSFTQDVNPIIQTKCAVSGCHANIQSPVLTTYDQIKLNASAINRRAVIEKTMPPPGPLPENEQRLIREWVCQGAPNN